MWGSSTRGKSDPGSRCIQDYILTVYIVQLGRCATEAISPDPAARHAAQFQHDRRLPELRQGKAPRRAGRTGESASPHERSSTDRWTRFIRADLGKSDLAFFDRSSTDARIAQSIPPDHLRRLEKVPLLLLVRVPGRRAEAGLGSHRWVVINRSSPAGELIPLNAAPRWTPRLSFYSHGQPLDAVVLVRSEDVTEQAPLSEVSTFWSNVEPQQVSLHSCRKLDSCLLRKTDRTFLARSGP